MNVILMGPQGSGKGTQAGRIGPRLGLTQVATGELFRAAIAARTGLGRRIKDLYDRGDLVPDDLTIGLVEEKLDEIDRERDLGEGVGGALFDGFPRNREQAKALDAALARREQAITAVVRIDVPLAMLVARLAGRRVCKRCGAVYHVEFNPPRADGVCDRCGGEVVQREDDTAEAVTKRLEIYFKQTEPLLAYYEERGLVAAVDGDRPIEAVTEAIVAAITRHVPSANAAVSPTAGEQG
ncbi:MAG: Adenylate kinase [uncultured Thermomicrobiales bacterium]|uniref:Adenylate kinase n=1 Tax=uncultured Thermomicrobiales bacterium TaxID=1645740 RepID=A0A6J4UHQ4_9BACT|nr:MAG: Adenylate kinase [uncultured Thermomicrobiales bacterium]